MAPIGYGDVLPVGARHPLEHLLRRQNRRHAAEEIAGDADGAGRREQRLPGFRQRLVAADVIGIGARVDDVADRLRRELLDRGHDRSRPCRGRPASTTTTPSSPIWTPMLPPAPAIMKKFGRSCEDLEIARRLRAGWAPCERRRSRARSRSAGATRKHTRRDGQTALSAASLRAILADLVRQRPACIAISWQTAASGARSAHEVQPPARAWRCWPSPCRPRRQLRPCAVCGHPARGSRATSSGCSKSGVNPNATDADGGPGADGRDACSATRDIVELLLSHGADPNRTGPGGATALMWAVTDVEKVRTPARPRRQRERDDRTPSARRCSSPRRTRARSASCGCCSSAGPTFAPRIAAARPPCRSRSDPPTSTSFGFSSSRGLDPNALLRSPNGARLRALRPADDRLPDVEGAGAGPGSAGRRRDVAARRSLVARWIELRRQRQRGAGRRAVSANGAHERRGVGSGGRRHGQAAARSRRRPERQDDGRRNVARLGDLQGRPREDRGARAARRRARHRPAPRRRFRRRRRAASPIPECR